MKKKSLRLIITEECNFNCSYCCNRLPDVRSKFVTMDFSEIEFDKYDSICITGGEPLMIEAGLGIVLGAIKRQFHGHLYLYTNGDLVTPRSAFLLRYFDGISVGVHDESRRTQIDYLLTFPHTRFLIEDTKVSRWEGIIPPDRIKPWRRNECDITDREDWVMLK
jgi:Molybdenum cofactor biosynthesis enzyme